MRKTILAACAALALSGPAVAQVPAYTPVTGALAGTATSSAVTESGGRASITGGVATFGPLRPVLGRDMGLRLWTTNGATFSCQVKDSVDGGVTILPITVAGQSWGLYTAAADEQSVYTPINSGTTVYLICSVTNTGMLNVWMGF